MIDYRKGPDRPYASAWVVQAVEAYMPTLSSVVNCLGTDDLLTSQDPGKCTHNMISAHTISN